MDPSLNQQAATEYSRNFALVSCKNGTREEKYQTIKQGCDILSKLYAKNIILIILQIVCYLDWPAIARASELIDFNLISCILTSSASIKRIFFTNTLYSASIKKFKYLKLNLTRLYHLSALDLFREYNIISRYPVYNILDVVKITKKFRKVTDAQFHPTEQLLAVIFDYTHFVLYAYGKGSFLQQKCLNTNVLFERSYQNDVCYGLQWSAQGSYLSFFIGTIRLTRFPEWLPKNNITYPKCEDHPSSKYIYIFHLNVKTGLLTKISNDENDFTVCNWKQSKYIWSSDNSFIYFYMDNIFKVNLDCKKMNIVQEKLLSKFKSLLFNAENFSTLLNVENFLGMMIHPKFPQLLMFVTSCTENTHCHHALTFFHLEEKRIVRIFSIPGIISNIMMMIPNDTKIIIRYFYFLNNEYILESNTSLNQHPYDCKLELPANIPLAQFKNFYINDVHNDYRTSCRAQQFLQLDLSTMSYTELLKKQFTNTEHNLIYHEYCAPYEWLLYDVNNIYFMHLTNHHLVLSNQLNNTITRIGRHHTMLHQHYQEPIISHDKSIRLFHPAEEIFVLICEPYFKFYYNPRCIDVEKKLCFIKQYRCFQKYKTKYQFQKKSLE